MSAFNIIVTHTLNDGDLTDHPGATGTVTRGMMRSRAVALAVMNGRSPQEASKADWEAAKRGLAGQPPYSS